MNFVLLRAMLITIRKVLLITFGLGLSATLVVTTACKQTDASKPQAKGSEVERVNNAASEINKIGAIPTGEDDSTNLQFISEQEGWYSAGKKLWRTKDAGKMWTPVYSSQTNIQSFGFVSPQVGWLLLSDEILKTENGGDTWTQLNNPIGKTGGRIYSVKFLKNGNEGWVVGGSYERIPPKLSLPTSFLSPDGERATKEAIYRTIDGGKNWSQQPIASPEWGNIDNLFLLDDTHAWAIGVGRIFYLEEGKWIGINYGDFKCGDFKASNAVLEDEDTDALEPVDIYFVSPTLGWLAFKNGQLAESKDGGRSWCFLSHSKDMWPKIITPTYNQKLSFIDSVNGWWKVELSLYTTKDGGASWEEVDENIAFYQIFFFGSRYGWAAAKEGLFRIK